MRNALDLWREGNPFSVFNDMDRIFNRVLRSPIDEYQGTSMVGFNPACDIEEEDDHYLVSMDLPGMSEGDVKIEVVDNRLVISGERKHETKESGRRTERFYGRFERSFALPHTTDAEKIEANYQNGVLQIAVPKAESAKPRTIQINSGKEGFFGKFLGRAKGAQDVKEKNKDRLVS